MPTNQVDWASLAQQWVQMNTEGSSFAPPAPNQGFPPQQHQMPPFQGHHAPVMQTGGHGPPPLMQQKIPEPSAHVS